MRTIHKASRLMRFKLHRLRAVASSRMEPVESDATVPLGDYAFRRTPCGRLLVCLTALSFGLGGCATLTDSAQDPPVLTISHGGMTMDGPDSAYTLEIYADGLARYHGELKVYIIGDRQAKMTPEQVQQLIVTYKKTEQLLKKMDVISKKKGFDSSPSHSPTRIRLQYQGEVSEIWPAGFAEYMFTKLEAMTPLNNWLCFPEDDPRGKNRGCSNEPRHISPMDVDKILDESLMSLEK